MKRLRRSQYDRDRDQILALHDDGMSIAKIITKLGHGTRQSLHTYIQRREEHSRKPTVTVIQHYPLFGDFTHNGDLITDMEKFLATALKTGTVKFEIGV